MNAFQKILGWTWMKFYVCVRSQDWQNYSLTRSFQNPGTLKARSMNPTFGNYPTIRRPMARNPPSSEPLTRATKTEYFTHTTNGNATRQAFTTTLKPA